MQSPWTVLIIDDSPDDRAEAKACLLRGSTRPYVFLEAETGADGLGLFGRQGGRRIDCVVVDFSLPDMDAVEILEALPRDPAVPDLLAVPVVVLTGSAAGDENRLVLRAGAQDFVGKAWLTPASLTRALENAIERHAMARERQRLLVELSAKQTAVQEAAARIEAIVHAVPDGIITLDERGTIQSVNPAAEQIFAYRAPEMVGHDVSMIVPLSSGAEGEGSARWMRAQGEHKGRRKDGSEFPIELTISEAQLEGRRIFAGIVRDITERSRAEEERRRLLDNERTARGDAERANRLKDEFLATLSHELRTPLTAILGWTHILLNNMAGPEKLEQGLQVIHRNARIQEQLVADLLDMSRIISGKLRLDFQPLNLALVVEAAVEAIRPTAEAKGIRIQRIMESIDEPMHGDATRLQQVVWNLLSNAVKFTPQGGKVKVVVSLGEGGVEIAVSDSGKGIKPEFLPHVFERFRQADASATREHGGLGLGLSIVKQLVDLHGGRVRVDSPGEGLGATFTVELPLAAAPAPRVPGPRPSTMPPNEVRRRFDRRELRGVKVLVVDDEPDTRDVVKRILEECEAEVITAASAEDGFERLIAAKPDVLVSDIGMPGQDGHEFIRRVRAAGKAIPAVALTAFARREDKERALLAGYQAHVAKPVVPSELLATVASLSEHGHAEQKDEQAAP
ncbi:response regulator [Polyangium aurulentum]|uniref:ATP-binding response regulator n=1 Tax=Polyangium aurulentum TaxID=2567896 RepID=UPI0010AE361C|nr:response regulator [Polyangium aurulentum]UQA62553.1 response regulator [Polyangium aurulentum]